MADSIRGKWHRSHTTVTLLTQLSEDEIRNALGKALLLELHKPSQKLQYRYLMDSEWFEKHETGELIYRFLDSLALLVATGPGGHNVTACALDTHRPKDESSGRKFSTFFTTFLPS